MGTNIPSFLTRTATPAARPAANPQPTGGDASWGLNLMPASTAPSNTAVSANAISNSGSAPSDASLTASSASASYVPGGGAAYTVSTDPTTMVSNCLAIFQQGVQRGLAQGGQSAILQSYLAKLNPSQLNTIANLLNQAGTQSEQVFILKAYAAGETWDNITQYANEMRGQPESTIIRCSLISNANDLIQQWQDACGPTMIESLAADTDPRFAWELHKSQNDSTVDPNGVNAQIAAQQQQWMQQYGGVAVPRGQSGGTGIAINGLLNSVMAPMLHVSYSAQAVNSGSQACNAIAQQIQGGYDVPLRVSWDQPNSGQDDGHFMLALSVQGNPGARQFLIHDPWTGKSAWIAEQNIDNNNFSPIFNQYTRVTHYYQATPTGN